MKTISKKIVLILLGALFLVGCNKSDDDNGSPAVDLTVTTLSPTAGEAGTVVTITGSGFDATMASNNTVSFNGTTATATSVADSQLEVTVPAGATTGPVSVTVSGETAEGPAFTYDERLKFEGEYENDNYMARLNRPVTIDTILPVNGVSEIEIKLIANSTNEIEVDIRDFLEEGINEMVGVSNLVFTFDDDIIAEVDGNEFEIEPFNFIITEGGTTTAPCVFEEGEGVLEDGELLFSFQYTVEAETPFTVSAEDVELELE